MDGINFLLAGLNDMDKVIVFMREDSKEACHSKKMIFRKERLSQFQAGEILKIDGYLSRFPDDLKEKYVIINVPDVWFRPDSSREEDFDLIYLPKSAIANITPAVETILKRFHEEIETPN